MQQHSVAVVGLNEIFGKIVLTESSWARGESGKERVKVSNSEGLQVCTLSPRAKCNYGTYYSNGTKAFSLGYYPHLSKVSSQKN